MHFEVWDARSNNLVGACDTREEALDLVRDAIASNGCAVAEDLALLEENDVGMSSTFARGGELVSWAESSGPASRRGTPKPALR